MPDFSLNPDYPYVFEAFAAILTPVARALG